MCAIKLLLYLALAAAAVPLSARRGRDGKGDTSKGGGRTARESKEGKKKTYP